MQRRTCTTTVACVLLSLFVLVPCVLGQLPRIRLNSIHPVGGQIGTKVPVTISGELTETATQLVFSHPDIEAIQQMVPESTYRAAHRKSRTFDVHVGDKVPPGRYEVRALGPAGLSAPRSFVVSSLSNHIFDGTTNSRLKAFPVEVGSAANAQCRAGERDYFKFTAEQHRPLLIQIFAQRIDSKMDAVLTIYDEQGNRIERIRQSLTRDPILSFSPPSDGQYTVEVSDTTYQGGDQFFYRLEVSELPFVEAIFPPVAKHGTKTKFTVYGYNLPGGLPVSGLERHGHLQSAEVTFAPDFEAPTLRPGWHGHESVSSVRVDGRFVSLPDQFMTAPPVFLAQSQNSILSESASNPTKDTPQKLSLPANIAGQFYPRRDRDWYSFNAKKGETFRIELATHQFGLPTDPTLRIERKKNSDGETTYQSIATSDDLEGPPKSRDARRLYSGTSDISYRFRAPEDGAYVLSVSDQYNVAVDDPRLTYQLTIQSEKSDFELLAFADPERFMDDKIAKPNGLGILPGGSSTVRVRLIPKHGFNSAVNVLVEGLPDGVTANPILLNASRAEGLLVLRAAAGAQPVISSIRIAGTTNDDSTKKRYAKTVAIVHGTNNTDAAATQSRKSSDLTLAVLDNKPSPVGLRLKAQTVKTCRGAKTALPLELARRDDFQDVEIAVSAMQLPSGLKLEAKKSKSSELQATLNATDAKLKAGQFTILLAAKVKDKRPRAPHRVTEAQADIKKISKLVDTTLAELKSEGDAAAQLAAVESKTMEMLTALQSRTSEPRNKLTENLRQQKTAAQTLAQKLTAALKDTNNAELRSGLTESEDLIARLQKQRKTLQSQLDESAKELKNIASLLAEQKAAMKVEQEKIAALTTKRDELQKQKAEANKRFQEAEKADQQEVEFWVYADPVLIDVAGSPVQVEVGNQHQITQGGTVEIPISIERGYQFNDQVTIQANPPGESGLAATPLVLGRGITTGKLLVTATNDAKQREWPIDIQLKMKFNNVEVSDQTKIRIQITPAKPKKEEPAP